MPTEKTQMSMFQEDLEMAILGQVLLPGEQGTSTENVEPVEETEEEKDV